MPESAVGDHIETLIRDTIARRLASGLQPHPEAIVLTGSFARGEGSVAAEGDVIRVLGDMEFMIVFPLNADRARLQRDLNVLAKELSQDLAACQVECELEFRAVDVRYFEAMRPHIFGYELLWRGRTVWGNANILASVPRFPTSAIPHWDAWRMLNNRLLEQLEHIETLESCTGENPLRFFYRLIKLQLDMGTSMLVFAGRYEDTYAGRAQALFRWAAETGHEASASLVREVAERVRDCTAFKLSPGAARAPLGVHLNREHREELRRELLSATVELVGLARRVWRWEAAAFANQEASSDANDGVLWERVLARQTFSEKVRGWAKLVFMPEVRQQPGFAGRLLKHMGSGSPRYLIYRVATFLYFQLPEVLAGIQSERELAELEGMLPVVFGEHADEGRPWWRLRSNVLTGWRVFLRNHWA
jgi:hypothetical protein